jgi:IS30 family transposase
MSYTHLTENDRYVISYLILAGYSLREIGRRIGRDHTTISREIKRNRPANRDNDDVYWYEISQWCIQLASAPQVDKGDRGTLLTYYLNLARIRHFRNP